MRTNVHLSIAAVALMAGSLRAQTAIEWLGLAPTLRNADAGAVSADGSVVVGTGNGPWGVDILAYLWTSATGPILVPPLPGFTLVAAASVSGDGNLVVGRNYSSDGGPDLPYSWAWRTGAGPTALPMPAGDDQGGASRVSRDGSTIVGSTGSHAGGAAHAAIWRAGAVIQLGTLPTYSDSSAWAVSADGSVVAGNLYDSATGRSAAFRWTAATGMQLLAGLAPTRPTSVAGVSDDGRVTVGSSSPAPNVTRMVRWQEAGSPEVLGTSSWQDLQAWGVSGDGRVVVGCVANSSAVIYSDQTGVVGLQTFLASRGVDFHGWSLQYGQSITPDARYIVGNGWNGATTFNNPVPWRVSVSGLFCYANCDTSTAPPILNINDFICFLNKLAAGDVYANCDGSTTSPVINVLDYVCFLNKFAAGCP